MGTNYYAIPKVTEEKEKQLIDLSSKKDWMGLRSALLELDEIHIGKSSMGWKFRFDHNNWQYFNQNKQAIIDFINSCTIRDEYGRPCSVDEFWDLVHRKVNGLDTKAYYEKYPDHRSPHDIGDSDLYVEDLLFSTYTDFS